MTPTLAMFTTAFGPAPTILGIAIGLCWIWCIWKKYPLNQPFLRLVGVVYVCMTLSMALGFNDTFSEKFRDGSEFVGGYGGIIGRFVAQPILEMNLPLLTGLVVTFLVVAVIASIVLATEWLGIPLFFRLQQMDPAFASTGYVGNAPIAAPEPKTAQPMHRVVPEDDSTADPLVSFGGSSESATATLERDEIAPSTYSPPQGVLGRRTQPDDEVLPPSTSGDAFAPEDEGDPASTPWYARRRARRDAERAEREIPEAGEDPDASPRAERRSRYASDFEREPTFDDSPTTSPEFDSTENQAATSDLEARLAESVEFAAPPAEPPVEEVRSRGEDRPLVEERMPEVAPPVEDSAPEAAGEPVAEKAPPASLGDDSFADFFGGVSEALTGSTPSAPEIAPPEPAPAEQAEPIRAEREIEPVAERRPEPEAASAPSPVADEPPVETTTESIRETVAETPVVETSPVAEEPVAEPVRSVAAEDPEQQLFLAAGDAVVTGQRASISFLQRSLSIGYFQAAKLLDRLEREGVIGPYTGAVSRNVLMDPSTWAQHKNG